MYLNRVHSEPRFKITVSLDTSKTFDTFNIHTLPHKLHQTNIPHTVLKFIPNYIEGRQEYTTFRNKHLQNTKGTCRRHHYNINTQQNKHSKSKYLIIHTWTQTYNLILNPNNTTCTLFHQTQLNTAHNLHYK